MSELERAGRELDRALSRLELAALWVERHPLAYEAQAMFVGYAYQRWRRALIEERERRLCEE